MLKVGLLECLQFGYGKLFFGLLGVFYGMVFAFKMEMSAPPEKNIVSQTEDIGSRS